MTIRALDLDFVAQEQLLKNLAAVPAAKLINRHLSNLPIDNYFQKYSGFRTFFTIHRNIRLVGSA
jgi:hypothetical protein